MSIEEQDEGQVNLAAMIAKDQELRQAVQDARPRRHRDGPRQEIEPASGWLEDVDFYADDRDRPDIREDQDRRVRTFTRQVCVRLSARQHAELKAAASLYGVAPGTMARILVRRGAGAVVDHHRVYDLEQGNLD